LYPQYESFIGGSIGYLIGKYILRKHKDLSR